MMKQTKALNVGIVGGGPGCKAIMDMIFAEKLSQLRMTLVGVACTNPNAVGYHYAQEKGIYTTRDYRDLYRLEDLEMIIELTGREDVANEIWRTKPDHVRLMDNVSARLFWDVFQIEEERIAERRRSEAATKLAYAELNHIFETSVDGMRVIDKDFNVLRVNETFSALSCVSKQDAIGKKCYEVFHGPLCHTPSCPLSRVVGGEERVERDAVKERADGSEVCCIVAATAFRGPDGELIGIVENFKDITERKQAEEALQEERNKLEAIVDAIEYGLTIQDRDYNIIYQNEVLRDIFGGLGEKCYRVYEGKDKTCDGCPVQMAWADGTSHTSERKVVMPSGEIAFWENTASPIRDASGEIVACLEIARNITERKRAENALRASEEKYRSLVESTEDSVYLIDSDCTYLFMNKKHLSRFSLPEDKVIGKTYGEFHSEEETKTLTGKVNEVIETGKSLWHEYQSQRDGRYFLRTLSPVKGADGRAIAVTVISKDITERKRLEAQLQHAQRMEAIGTLAGGIAHDFNNLLMGIQGHASLVSLDTDLDHPHYEHLKGIEHAVQQGADLTRQLLGFARGGKYEVQATNLNELIKKSSEMFGRTRREIKIHRKYQKELWPVEVDQAQIEQVLLNLYVNAWQAMPHGGDLYIETSNVELDDKYTRPFSIEPGNYVKISVTDTGTGMDKAMQQRIFDPFFTTRETGRGTGLGLSSAYGIIKNHGGIINVYSEKGKGATFNIYLAASEKQPAIREKRPPEEILHGTETVLLVDDERMILDVGEEMLKKMGYRVLLATSGNEAVELCKKHKNKINLVILDMVMPDMGGGEAYDRMKENNPRVKVLLSSGYSIDGQATQILERGCDGFIQKPFNMRELSRKMREILEKK